MRDEQTRKSNTVIEKMPNKILKLRDHQKMGEAIRKTVSAQISFIFHLDSNCKD